jgi:hypothetical protein
MAPVDGLLTVVEVLEIRDGQVAQFFGPSRELADDKERFVSARRRRWFGP